MNRYRYMETDWSESSDGIEGISYFTDSRFPTFEVRIYTTNGIYGDGIRVNIESSDYKPFKPQKYMMTAVDEAYYKKHIVFENLG